MMDQGFSTEFAEIAAPQNCEVAARFPSLAAGQTDARNGLACVGCIDEWHLLTAAQFAQLSLV